MEDDERFVSVDYRDLSEKRLLGLIEEFVSREGTDYGLKERSFEAKVRDVEKTARIRRGADRVRPLRGEREYRPGALARHSR